MKKLLLLLFSKVLISSIYSQGVTTSSINGKVVDSNGEALFAANIAAVHEPSGTLYGNTTNLDGLFRIDHMRVGGPYTITTSFIGFENVVVNNVYLRLGEPYRNHVTMGEYGIQLGEVVVVAKAGSVGKNSGSSTQISTEDIELMPTLNRDIDDFLRLTPQSSSFSGGTSFAGINNRFNAIYIDGAVNNDVFGLASSGTNGGQTGISPFSIDIIDQFQVVLSPYDVTLGGFAGGGINAVTKSGTNNFSGTAYYFFQNEGLVGKTNGKLAERLGIADDDRTRVADFSKKTYGASLGGPIAKNKAFFFVNAEIQKDVTPIPFEPAVYTGGAGRTSESGLNNLSSFLMNTYNYDPGSFGETADELEGLKLFGKININLSNSSELVLRHQYTKAEEFDRSGGSSRTLNFSNNGVFFPSTTNSFALELNSRIGSDKSNNLIVGYTNVNDDRGSLGSDFPFVIIDDAGGQIRFGTEPFSTGNILKQKIITITDNFKIYKGKHTYTIGTHNEFYDIFNLFLPWNFGQYEYDNVDDFLTGAPADAYRRVYSLVDNITGDGSAAAAEFKAMQLGFYFQDQIEVNEKLRFTAGLRLDVPILTDDPVEAPRFNSEVLPRLAAQYDVADNVEAGTAPSGQLMWSPRIGFDYSVNRKSTLRGGLGIFTSRIPFVWPGAMYNNNGLTSTFLGDFAIPGDVNFIPDIQRQYTFENPTVPSGDMNLFTKDFKYPQVFRGNLAYDKEYGSGWFTSLEALYTKTLNNVIYYNINTDTGVDFNWTGSGDRRPIFNRSEIDQDAFGAVYVADNTSQGYTYNITASVAKRFASGFNLSLAYSFTEAEAVNEGTSSQNSSQWRGQIHTHGRNNPIYGRADYASGHRLISSMDYTLNWGSSGKTATTFSLFYNGQNGVPFSYVIGGRNARNMNNQRGSTSRNRSLVYVPADANDINLVDYTSGGSVVSAVQQWTNLNALIESDPSLSGRRGDYVEKNGARAPWSSAFDLAIRQNFGTDLGGNVHKFQLSLDIFNLSNLLNKNWGTRYFVPGDFNNYFLYDFEGYDADGTTPQFTYRDDQLGSDRFDIASLGSRWSMRLGLRYIFGKDTSLPYPSGLTPAGNLKADTDGDGIKDSKDQCPEIAGIRKYKGCPMSAEDMAAKAAAEKAERMEAEAAAKAKADAEAKARAEAEAKRRAEAEAKRLAEEAEARRIAAEAEAARMAEAEAAAAKAAAIKARDTEVRKVFDAALRGIQFNSAKYSFKQESYTVMDEVVSVMSRYSDIRVLIQGHTDSQGDDGRNKTLSENRANAVRDYLISKGVTEGRLVANGLGEDYPVADNKTSEGRANNRRVEFFIMK